MKTTLLEVQRSIYYGDSFEILMSNVKGAKCRQAIGPLDIDDLKLLRELICKAIREDEGK
jgi:hypothetical protein